MPIELFLLGASDAHVLDRLADDVFDGPIVARYTRDFLDDPRHHIIVARDGGVGGVVVGMITAMNYVHPDKAPQLWINEIGVATTHLRQGIAKRLMQAMLDHGRTLGCTEAWVGTEVDNVPARRLYESTGGELEMFAGYTFALNASRTRPEVQQPVRAALARSNTGGEPSWTSVVNSTEPVRLSPAMRILKTGP